MNKSRVLELDAMRGLAALAVVFYHYLYHYNNIYGHEGLSVDWARGGKYGVQLFFMISGYVIYWSLENVKSPIDFLVSRFSRLYPTFWFAAFLTFTIVWFWGLPGREIPLNQAIMNVLMFHQYLWVKNIDGVYWTLTIELTFYFWIFTIFVFRGLKYTEILFIPLIGITLLESVGKIELPFLYKTLFMVGHIQYFLAGICMYKLINDQKCWRLISILFLCLVTTYISSGFKILAITIFFFIAFYFAVSTGVALLRQRFFVFFGAISYPLYLLHQNIGFVIINEAYKYNVKPLYSIAMAVSISIILAYVTMRFVERPSVSFIRLIYKNIPPKK